VNKTLEFPHGQGNNRSVVLPSPGRDRDNLREESLFKLKTGKEGFLGEKPASE
jgi:hypothetical protein